MNSDQFSKLMKKYDNKDILRYLIELNGRLNRYDEPELEIDFNLCLGQLSELVEKLKSAQPSKGKAKSKETNDTSDTESAESKLSLNVYKLISKNLILVLAQLPTKTYDFANALLNHLNLNESGNLPPIAKASIILLIDLFETYPNSLNSLVSFSVNQIYKIIKKHPDISSSLIFLLNSITKNATKFDVDDKLQAKLLKIINKNVYFNISFELPLNFAPTSSDISSTVLLKKNYMLVLKNILLLSVSSNYENLLALSTSSSSAGSKLKPEAIMLQQHQFQMNLLSTNEKVFRYGLTNFCKEVRIATVELLAHLFINFIPTGKFNPIDYLTNEYTLPHVNSWDDSLSAMASTENETVAVDVRKEKNTIWNHDSENIIRTNTDMLLYQTGIIEILVFYIQLEQFQNSDYLSGNLVTILDTLLSKFGELNNIDNHIQNQYWNRTLKHFTSILDYIIDESGSTCHEILMGYTYSKFNLDSSSDNTEQSSESINIKASHNRDNKRESKLFTFKTGKNSLKFKNKDARQKEIIPYQNSYQCYLLLHIIEILLPFGLDFNSIVQTKQALPENSSEIQDGDEERANVSKEIEEEVEEEEEEEQGIAGNDKSFLRDIIFKLLINNRTNIRIYALTTLLKYASNNEAETNQLILDLYNLVSHEYKNSDSQHESNVVGNVEEHNCGLIDVRLMSYSLALLALIKQTDSTLLQNSTIVRILSFCTQSLKHNSHNNAVRNSACWTILSSLITFYNDSEFVKLNSSQFLVFWKGLLTSQFISSSLNNSSQEGQQREIVDNLKLRNSSLICLLNYLNSVQLTPESLKQLQFLLTKSYNYLTFLENNIEGVGPITNFTSLDFNENDYNPIMVNNIHYSNFNADKKLSFERVMISLILYSKKILLQSFIKLAALLKNDINSNMVIFLVKLFSDSKIFSRCFPPEHTKEKSKSSSNKANQTKINDYDNDIILLGEDYNYSFGVTSKFQGYTSNIDELLIKLTLEETAEKNTATSISYKDAFSNKEQSHGSQKSMIESSFEDKSYAWFDYFEHLILQSVDHNVIYDPNIYLVQDYSVNEQFSSNIITSLIDLSIELFQLVFPYLSPKIKFSLLEQMRNFLTAKSIDPLRYKAVCVNISIALHGVLSSLIKKKQILEKDILNVLLDILVKIETNNMELLFINCDSVGLACGVLTKDREFTNEHINKFIGKIVNDINPYQRGTSILSLSRIHQYTHIGFSDVYNVALQLLKDPNPIVLHYSLKATNILLESNLDNLHLIPELLDNLYNIFLNDGYGYDLENKLLINLKCKFGSIGTMTQLVKLCVTSLGPNLRLIGNDDKLKIRDLIVGLSYGIGCVTLSDYLEVYENILRIFPELIIFDPKLIKNGLQFYTNLLDLIISKNLKVGLVTTSPTSLNKDIIFPFNSSFLLLKSAFECYVGLIKIHGSEILSKETVKILWIAMNLKPCEQLKQLIRLWMESSLEMNWFMTLNSLFKYSSKKLTSPFIEVNYLQKLLPLQQRQKKKNKSDVDFRDEEIENIVGNDDESSDKNEPITWEFKLFIFDLLNDLLEYSNKNSQLLEQLKTKIQDIIKISFLGSSSPITSIKLKGVSLLDKALRLFGDFADPLYPGVSILEQQQALIISALIPCFKANNNSKVIVNAINVSSKFINLPRIKFYSKHRILKTLIYLLEEISSSKFLRFSYLENMSEFGKKTIQLSILNCWALLKINVQEDEEIAEPELVETLDNYSMLLNSLWVLVLREYSMLKYNETASKELAIYESYWLNIINVLSLELKNDKFVDEYLSGDAHNFLFILFSQCIESLIKNKNVSEILVSLNRLVQSPYLIDLIFNDEIFGEVINLFDRLILIDDDTDIKCKLVDTISTTFLSFTNKHNDLTESFDKLFELIRVCMLPLFDIIPFLRTDFDPSNESTQLLMKHADSSANLILIKNCLHKLVDMMCRFPDIVKADLYSCLLFIFAKFYENGNDLLISTVLPHLKQIIAESKTFKNTDLVSCFSKIIRKYYKVDKANDYSVLTTMILITSGDIELNDEDSHQFSTTLIEVLRSPESTTIGIQCIKSLIQYSSRLSKDILVMKYLISGLIKLLANGTLDLDPKIIFEILFLFSKSYTFNETKTISLFSILMPLLTRLDNDDRGNLNKSYLHDKLLSLIQQNTGAFKFVIDNVLTEEQKKLTEDLVKLNTSSSVQNYLGDDDGSEIQLKTFGS